MCRGFVTCTCAWQNEAPARTAPQHALLRLLADGADMLLSTLKPPCVPYRRQGRQPQPLHREAEGKEASCPTNLTTPPASLPGVATQQRMDSFFRILPFTNNNKKQLAGAKRKGRRAGGQARKKSGPRSRRMKHLELSII